MRAIELETQITLEGHIVLPELLHNLYGKSARLILLLEEPSADKENTRSKLLMLRGAMEHDTEFDGAMRDIEKAWLQWQP